MLLANLPASPRSSSNEAVNLARASAPSFVPQCHDVGVLHRVLNDDAGMAVWHRLVPGECCPALRTLLDEPPFSLVAEGSPRAAVQALSAAVPSGATALLDDVRRLAAIFVSLTGNDAVRLRLEHVADDACSCFHVDNVGLRLLCTYAGPGTEWQDARGATHQIATGAVAVLKGATFPGDAPRVPHRSPPVGHLPPGLRSRLLLVIDQPGVF